MIYPVAMISYSSIMKIIMFLCFQLYKFGKSMAIASLTEG